MHGRSEVVPEAGQRQLQGACGAAGLRLRLENVYLQAGLSQNDGRGQTIGACADNGGSSLNRLHSRHFALTRASVRAFSSSVLGKVIAATNAVTLWEQFPFWPHAFFVVAHVEKQPAFPVWLFV